MHLRIKELREDHDLTQEYMAHILNVNQRIFSRYENGEHMIPLESLCKIADFFDVSVDFILCRTDIKEAYPKSKFNKFLEDNQKLS